MALIKCNTCNKDYLETCVKCPFCGDTRYNIEKTCECCNEVIDLSKKACSKCGHPIRVLFKEVEQITENEPKRKSSMLCVISFCLSVPGVVIPPLLIISLILAFVSFYKFDPKTQNGKGFSSLATIISLSAIFIWTCTLVTIFML